MTPAAYEFMRKVFLQGSVPVTNAVPLAIVTNMYHDNLLDVEENGYVMTLKGKQAFVKYMAERGIANKARELDDTFISFHLAERTGNGYDGNPFAVSNEMARTMFQILIHEGKLKNSEVECAYDYAVFEFTNPVTGVQYRMFPDDIIVYTVEHGYVVHNFRKDE